MNGSLAFIFTLIVNFLALHCNSDTDNHRLVRRRREAPYNDEEVEYVVKVPKSLLTDPKELEEVMSKLEALAKLDQENPPAARKLTRKLGYTMTERVERSRKRKRGRFLQNFRSKLVDNQFVLKVSDKFANLPKLLDSFVETASAIINKAAEEGRKLNEVAKELGWVARKEGEQIDSPADDVVGTAEGISEAIEEIPEVIDEISEAAEEIPEADEEIPEADEEIPEDDVVDTAEGISEPIEEIPEALDEISEAAEEIPEADEEIPEADEEIPEADEEIPAAGEEVPEIEDSVDTGDVVDTGDLDEDLGDDTEQN